MRRSEYTCEALSGFPPRRRSYAAPQGPTGIGGWLMICVLGRVALLAHQVQLTVGAIIVYLDPAVVGLHSFVPVGSLLIYEATNWLLVGLTIVALLLIRSRSSAAPRVNLALSGLWLTALVMWHFLGLKSSVGTVIDATPALFGLWYFLTSKRVRNTLTQTPELAQEGPS